MNYYSHHIGDFNNATRHLTRLERSIYRDMIDLYYDTEMPLTLDLVILCRKLMARTEEEVIAVEQLLNEFFIKTASGWFHSRCDEEITEYHKTTSAKSTAGKASAAKRAEEKRLRIEELNKSSAHCQQSATNNQQNSTGVEQVLNSVDSSVQLTNNQEPITNNQEPINPTPPPLVVEKTGEAGVLIKPEVALSIAFRSFGIKTQPANPKLIELTKQGVTVDLVNAACEDARSAKPDASFNYVVAIIERWCKEASALHVKGAVAPQARASPSGSASDKRSNWMNELRGDGNGQNGNQRIIDIN